MPSVRLMKSIPRALNSSKLSIRCFQRTSEPVEFPDQNHIERTLARIPHQSIELGPMALGATDARIGVFVVVGEALAGVSTEVFELHFAVLVQGAHAGIKGHDFLWFLSRWALFTHPRRASSFFSVGAWTPGRCRRSGPSKSCS